MDVSSLMDIRKNAALLIVAHGSTVNPDSSAPTLTHAAEIRRFKIFADVGCAFWKEEPSQRTSTDNRRYGGFIVRVYFDGQLQDSRANPPELLTLFPAADQPVSPPDAAPSPQH